jgi:hypothetical protein
VRLVALEADDQAFHLVGQLVRMWATKAMTSPPTRPPKQ